MPIAPLDAGALRDHLDQCAEARSRWHHWLGHVEALNAFVLPRFITSLMAVLLTDLALLWLLD